jgi:murein DD-endopeptidase MepM/ murein hydrolase activator NlpD
MRSLLVLSALSLLAFFSGAVLCAALTLHADHRHRASPTTATAHSTPIERLPVARLHVTSGFGRRFFGHHSGVDLRAREGEPLYAVAPGVVDKAHVTRRGGKSVVLQLDSGWRAGYAHMSRIDVTRGQTLQTGTQVGLAGRTGHASGPHLHFELRHPRTGALVDPIPYLGAVALASTAQTSVRRVRLAVDKASTLAALIRTRWA